MATKQTHLPAVSTQQLSTMATTMAGYLADTGKALETIPEMQEQIKKAQEALQSTKKLARDGLASLNTQIKELHRLGLDFGKVPQRKITFTLDESAGVYVVPDGASMAEILFHKLLQGRNLTPGSAYNLTSLVKFCVTNGTLLQPASEGAGLNYSKYLTLAQSEGVPSIAGPKQAFAQSSKGKYVKVLPKPTETKPTETKPTETKPNTKPTETKPTETKPDTSAPTVDESSLKGKREKSFLDHLLAAAIDNAGLGNILLAYAKALDKEPETLKSGTEAFALFIQVLVDLKLIVRNGNKVSKVTK